ncbi:hypothetical protein DFA_10794 [Cavenderia fasciculata]|uniref:DNA-directed DNA polymerase family B exonuclease domain-containing protein n=1 Tax=Cavenderia fasciculata TaxID=261658 RepID=F4QBE8_CACFS|nr:uncharacterized protein DFA_10794 [Cavenderia fasciculata]EGG14920.1 hypothetical protein DFA_10794 [Cavenderia fasciculata]|eukprot:XP_004351436.1 hypothetical protein DFA_10794 [Cavenderia fasciculata]
MAREQRAKKTAASLQALRRAKSGEEKRSEQIQEEEEEELNESSDDEKGEKNTITNIEEELEKKRKIRDFVVDDDEYGYRERSDGEEDHDNDDDDDYSGEEAKESKSSSKVVKRKKKDNSSSSKKDEKKQEEKEKKKKVDVVPIANRMDQFLNKTVSSSSSSSSNTTSSSTSMSLAERMQKSNQSTTTATTKSKTNDDMMELYLKDLQENPDQEMDIDFIEQQKRALEEQERIEKEKEKEKEEQSTSTTSTNTTTTTTIKNDEDLNLEDFEKDEESFEFDFNEDEPKVPTVTFTASAPVLQTKTPTISLVSPKTTNDWWKKAEDSVISIGEFENLCVKDVSSIPMITIQNQKGLEFFFLTAEEETQGTFVGKIYLFGKVKQQVGTVTRFVSCCIVVENLQRNVFLLPRSYCVDAKGEPTTIQPTDEMIEKEIKSIMDANKIKNWTCKKVSRSICFDYKEENKSTNISKYDNLWKISYPSNFAPLKNDIQGLTFKCGYGITSSPLELFLLKTRIMGPCWMVLRNVKPVLDVSQKISYCRFEARVPSFKDVAPFDKVKLAPQPSPPIVVMALSVKTTSTKDSNEILMISSVVNEHISCDGGTIQSARENVKYMTSIRPLTGQTLPMDFKQQGQSRQNLSVQNNERLVLTQLANTIMSVDPDMLAGHNIIGYDLDVIIHRMKELKVQNWSYLGKLRRTQFPRLSGGIGSAENSYQEKQVLIGRLVCDTYLLSKEFLQKEKNYSLVELSKTQLQIEKQSINLLAVDSYFNNSKRQDKFNN